MNDTALIFGAGKTGRGFAAQLAFLGGYDIILVDKNSEIVAELNQEKKYDIQVLDNEEKNSTIKILGAYHTSDDAWHNQFVKTDLVFTSVFGNNLEELAGTIAIPLKKRFQENAGAPLTIITCENLTGAAGFLKKNVVKHLGEEEQSWLSENVGFSESIIFRTCLGPGESQSRLTIRAQNFFELPCDGDAIKEGLHVYGLKPLKNFSNQLRRKIYTYNCINAVITYLGAKKGYSQLYEAGNDAEILVTARKAADETSRAQIAEFGFDPKEQEEWVHAAFAKFADTSIPDPIERNSTDPARKLGREDRLIGPALLALKHHIYPEGLMAGIIASLDYADPGSDTKISHMVKEKGPYFVLEEVCGLSQEEELFILLRKEIIKTYGNGR